MPARTAGLANTSRNTQSGQKRETAFTESFFKVQSSKVALRGHCVASKHDAASSTEKTQWLFLEMDQEEEDWTKKCSFPCPCVVHKHQVPRNAHRTF